MKRVEIISNSAMAEDIIEGLEHLEGDFYFTQINNVHGLGSSGPRRGDHIWPEENVIFIIYCKASESEQISSFIENLKKRFPHVGIKYFEIG